MMLPFAAKETWPPEGGVRHFTVMPMLRAVPSIIRVA
jgi:hypothetical protein